MFKQARQMMERAELDELGTRMAARKKELIDQSQLKAGWVGVRTAIDMRPPHRL